MKPGQAQHDANIARLTDAAMKVLDGMNLRHEREQDAEQLSAQLQNFREAMAGLLDMLATAAWRKGAADMLAMLPASAPPAVASLPPSGAVLH